MQKAITAVIAAIILGVGVVAPDVDATNHGGARYSITDLKALSKFKDLSINGMNAQGDIVATATIKGYTRVVVLLAAGTAHARLMVLPAPKGFRYISAAGINNQDMIAATAAHGGKDLPTDATAFVAQMTSSGFDWIELPQAGLFGWDVTGIANDGDVIATRYGFGNNTDRAVVWVYQGRHSLPLGANAYTHPRALKLSKGYKQSQATAIWSRGTLDVIGGAQGKGYFGNGITIWSPNPVQSSKSAQWLRPPAAIGGWGNHLYAVGRIMGIDTGEGWSAPVRLTAAGRAVIGPVTGLATPRPLGAECFYGADSVSAGRNGKMVAVGGVSCIAGMRTPRALMWRNNSVVNLQSRVAAGSGWRLQSADVINSRGQIVGGGKLHGKTAVYLLSPAALG